jgi:hypothetical protein
VITACMICIGDYVFLCLSHWIDAVGMNAALIHSMNTKHNRRGENMTTEKTYKIVRFFRVSGRRKIIARNQSLAMAQEHCNRDDTQREGVWFDGYEAE